MTQNQSVIQQLEEGKLLCKKNFPRFVESYNQHLLAIHNLKGDKDVSQNGRIEVDWASPTHPIIRYNNSGNGNADGISASVNVVENFEFEYDEDDGYFLNVIGSKLTFNEGILTNQLSGQILTTIPLTPWKNE